MGKYINKDGKEVEIKDSIAQKLIDAGCKLKPAPAPMKVETKTADKPSTPTESK